MTKEMTWQEHVKQADAHKALGQERVYLMKDSAGDFPWEFVTSCEPGGSHRLDISTDVRFVAEHPSGLRFDWSFDIEPYSANGKGGYEIDVAAIKRTLALLPELARKQFQEYLADCAKAVYKRAAEYQTEADKQKATASDLVSAAQFGR